MDIGSTFSMMDLESSRDRSTGELASTQPSGSSTRRLKALAMSDFCSDYDQDTLGEGEYREIDAAGVPASTRYMFGRYGDMCNSAMLRRARRSSDDTTYRVGMTFTPSDIQFAGDGTITFTGDERRLRDPSRRPPITQTYSNILTKDHARAVIGNVYRGP